MINHLSEEQFAKCLVGRSTSEELQHITECAACSAEVNRFTQSLSLFRGAIRDRIDDRVASQPASAPQLTARPATSGFPKWRWALRCALAAAAVVVLITVPFFTSKKAPPQIIEHTSAPEDPDAIMRAVNLHLSRTVPGPMEPMMALLPNEESAAKSRGVQ